MSGRFLRAARWFLLWPALGLALLPVHPVAADVEVRNPAVQLPKHQLVEAFDGALADMVVRLRNYGAQSGSGGNMSWHDNQSYIKLPGGQQWSLGIPEWVYSVPGTNDTRRWKIYINNMITTSVDARIEGSRIIIELKFGGTSYGPSAIARCIRRIAGQWGECAATGSAYLHNALIRVSLTPREWAGSVSYSHISQHNDIDFEYDLDVEHWLCGVDGNVCNYLKGKIQDSLTPMVKQMVAQQLNHSSIRNQVANAISQMPGFQQILFAEYGWKIVGITDTGSAFQLDMERRLATDFGAAVDPGSSCPKAISIVASATTDVPFGIEARYRIDGGPWTSFQSLDKITEIASLVHASRSYTTEPVTPGTRLVEGEIRPSDASLLWQRQTYAFSKPVDVGCPLKEVSQVELKAIRPPASFILLDSISELETDCPVNIRLHGRFTEHDGAGDVSYRFRFSEGNRVSSAYSTVIEHPMQHASYKTPTVVHEFPLPLPGLQPPDDPPGGDMGGFAQPQAPPSGPQIQGGFTGGATAGNEHKGSVRLEVVSPQGSATSGWLPYHIVCKPKTAVTPIGPLTSPQAPEQPAQTGVITAPPAAGSRVPPTESGSPATRASPPEHRVPATPPARMRPPAPVTVVPGTTACPFDRDALCRLSGRWDNCCALHATGRILPPQPGDSRATLRVPLADSDCVRRCDAAAQAQRGGPAAEQCYRSCAAPGARIP
jgi:hypothetical protein